jgi:hypothetical protein
MPLATGILVVETNGERDNRAFWYCSHECIVESIDQGMLSRNYVAVDGMIAASITFGAVWLCMHCNMPLSDASIPGFHID